MRAVARHAASLAGFALLAVLYTWPTVRVWNTHTFGPWVNTASSLWYVWHYDFTRSFWSDMMYRPYGASVIFQPGLFFAFIYVAIKSWVGLVASYNLFTLGTLVSAGYFVFLTAAEWGAPWAAAFLAGAYYAFAPDRTAGYMNGMELTYGSTHVVAFFVWAMTRLARLRRLRDAALAAAAFTAVWGCHYYYFLECALLVAVFYLVLEKPATIGFEPRQDSARLKLAKRAVEAALIGVMIWLGRRLWAHGQVEFHGGGGASAVLAYVAPYGAFWVLAGLRLALSRRAVISLRLEGVAPQAWLPYALFAGCYALLSAPLVWAILNIFSGGEAPASNVASWRGGGNPTDLSMLIRPQPYQPLWGPLVQSLGWAKDADIQGPGYVVLAAAIWLWRKRPQDRWVKLWFACAAFTLLFMMGPWLKLFGFHTYLPLPFYFTHLLPIFNQIQAGMHLGPFPDLFLGLLLAAALKVGIERYGRKATVLAFGLAAFELAHTGMGVTEITAPPIYARLAAMPQGVLLNIPMGAQFDGMGAHGDLGVNNLDNAYAQVFHHKPIYGGALARVPRYVYVEMRRDPFVMPLVEAQKGLPPAPVLKDARFLKSYFKKNGVRYVLVRVKERPQALALAMKAWPMCLIDEDKAEGLKLYQVTAE